VNSKKAVKMKTAIGRIIVKHREQDQRQTDAEIVKNRKKYVETIGKMVSNIRAWLIDNDNKPRKTGKPRKSNITDNESARMKT